MDGIVSRDSRVIDDNVSDIDRNVEEVDNVRYSMEEVDKKIAKVSCPQTSSSC